MFNTLFLRKSRRFIDNVEKFGKTRHTTDNNNAHAPCMLDN